MVPAKPLFAFTLLSFVNYRRDSTHQTCPFHFLPTQQQKQQHTTALRKQNKKTWQTIGEPKWLIISSRYSVCLEFHKDLVSYPIENKVLKNKSCLVFWSSLFFVPGALMEQFLNNDLMFLFPCKRCFLQSRVGSLFSSLALTFIKTTCILVVVVELYLFSRKRTLTF